MKNNTLKMLAMRAKNRMINRNGYVDARIKIVSDDDGEFIERVRQILEKGDDIINPIGQLMDEKILLKLDERGRERYLLETIERYLKAKKVIEDQRKNERAC